MFRNSFQGIKYLDIVNSKVKIYDGVSNLGLYVNLQNILDSYSDNILFGLVSFLFCHFSTAV